MSKGGVQTPASPRVRPYPKYMNSGVEWLGQIPAHWESLALKRIVDPARPVTYGIVQCGPDFPEGVPYIRPVDMDDEGGIKADALQRTSPDIAAAYVRSKVRPEDVVVSIGPSFGKAMIVPSELDGANLTQGTARISPGRRVTSRFLFWSLRSQSSRQAWDSYCSGATFRALTLEILETCAVALPPAAEQDAIVTFLDRETAKIDALVAKKERLIELLQEKRTTLITRIVTKGLDPTVPMKDSGVEWLGEIPSYWKIVRVKYTLKDKISGPFGSSLTKESYGGHTYRVYGQEQVIPGDFTLGDYYIPEAKFRTMTRYAVMPGDVLLSCVGTFGRAAVVPDGIEPGIINPRLILLRPDRSVIVPEYLEFFLKSELSFAQMDEITRGGTMDIINLSTISAIIMPLPPKAEQAEILKEVRKESSRIDALIAKVHDGIDRLKEYRTALISAAVTGKIDVQGEAA